MKCSQCGKPLNPVQVMIGPVCLSCCKKNHAAVMGLTPAPKFGILSK